MKLRGFSLIEAILSMTLLAAGLFGLLYTFQGAVTSSGLTDQSYVATNLARETMEKIIAQRDCNLIGCGYAATLTAISSNSFNASPVSGFPGYNLTATAVEVDPGTTSAASNFTVPSVGSGYARTTVTVTYNNGNNSVNLVTLLASY